MLSDPIEDQLGRGAACCGGGRHGDRSDERRERQDRGERAAREDGGLTHRALPSPEALMSAHDAIDQLFAAVVPNPRRPRP